MMQNLSLRNNYESLDYCHVMQKALDSVGFEQGKYLAKFDSALKLQERNTTEPGEKKCDFHSPATIFVVVKRG
ncbi:MAG: hypothetical protein WDO19_33270 [Bacteroidota bacterium]